MPAYVMLLNWTQKGIEQVRDSVKRFEAASDALESAGAKLVSAYLVMGEYDFVLTFEAPDDETASRVALGLASRGYVRTRTMRAFTEAEYRRIIASLA